MWFLASAGDPTSHVKDHVHLWGSPLTQHTITLLVVTALFVLVMMKAAKAIATGDASEGNDRYITKGKLSQMIEVMVIYLRDEMLKPVLGEKATSRYLPFLMSLFFFVLFNNLFGLIPIASIFDLFGGTAFVGGTATASITVTGALALVSFIVIEAHGFRELGVKGWIEHNFGGLVPGPIYLFPVALIVLVVELMGHIIKPAALAIRLFANMVAGHTLMAVLLGFGAAAVKGAGGQFTAGAAGVTLVTGVAAIAITFLELFVAFLQAFVFMFLTAVFISLLSHHEDHHEEEHGEAIEGGEALPASL